MVYLYFLLTFSSLFTHSLLFFFNAPPTTEIYTLSLHDALPIWLRHLRATGTIQECHRVTTERPPQRGKIPPTAFLEDRKSTHLNSSHRTISYAVFCLKKKKKKKRNKKKQKK